MVQELTYNVGIVGAGPCGCACAKFLEEFCNVTLFDFGLPLRTILPTGGGRCNFANAEFDFKNLAKNYPRGEKFLYSIFSRFSTAETLNFFESMGIKYYIQDDNRIFPKSNCATDLREKFLNNLKNSKFKKEKVLRINTSDKLEVVTDLGSSKFDAVIVTTGGHAGYNIAKYLDIKTIEPKPALVGLKTKENLSKLAGVVVKNTIANTGKINLKGDILFTHRGISGPLIYQISSILARHNFPYKIKFDFVGEIDLQNMLNLNSQKHIANLLSEIVPKSFAKFILNTLQIKEETKCHQINGKLRDKILESLKSTTVTIIGTEKDGEVVTCGGISLDEVNSKTLESKKIKNLYFGGEVLDIDGFCGGFNLQNCWSNAFIISNSIINSL